MIYDLDRAMLENVEFQHLSGKRISFSTLESVIHLENAAASEYSTYIGCGAGLGLTRNAARDLGKSAGGGVSGRP